MTNKKFKLAAMSLATAVAVSTVGPSASAVTYYLGDGSVTVDQDENRGAYSYQGEDGSENTVPTSMRIHRIKVRSTLRTATRQK